MQSIPDLAYEILIRNFILRFRPRSSELLSARYTEHLQLESSWITRSKWLLDHWCASPRMNFPTQADRTSKPKTGKTWSTQMVSVLAIAFNAERGTCVVA